jgi:hypothetical protein
MYYLLRIIMLVRVYNVFLCFCFILYCIRNVLELGLNSLGILICNDVLLILIEEKDFMGWVKLDFIIALCFIEEFFMFVFMEFIIILVQE